MNLAQLTATLGLPEHEQSAVLAWTGEGPGHEWTDTEAVDLARIWRATNPATGVYEEDPS